MPNTLTGLIPNLYEAMDVVSRELIGLIPSVTHDMSAARAAVGQNIVSFVAPASTSQAITPGVTAPNTGDQTIGTVPWTITNAESVPVRWNGEESRSLDNGSFGRRRIMIDQFAQAMRTLTNKIELMGAQAAYVGASRAFGTPGTTPFATDVSGTARVRKILDDNGAPPNDRSLIIDTSAGANLRTLQNLTRASEAGTTDILRQGVLLDLHGFALRESAQIVTATKGTGAAYTSNTAGYAVGATNITLITGTGTVLAGDLVQFAGDSNIYVVKTGVSAPGTITLAAPGLRVAIPAAATALTVLNTATRNIGFSRNAIALATRAPAVPEEGDMADDAVIITDPKSGLAFEVRLYKQYRQVLYEVAIAWGWVVMKPEHLAVLAG
jgi:hypothetical protein